MISLIEAAHIDRAEMYNTDHNNPLWETLILFLSMALQNIIAPQDDELLLEGKLFLLWEWCGCSSVDNTFSEFLHSQNAVQMQLDASVIGILFNSK